MDQFVLTRKINHAELVFNQDIHKDKIPLLRYFEKDAGSFWQLSQRNECYCCDKHQFVHVYFENGLLAKNQDFDEITDKDFLK